MDIENDGERMTDSEIIRALINRDETVTRQFFFKDCRPLFLSVMRHVFTYAVDYDEFVNEFYIYLMEENARRLRQFEGRSSLYQWLKIVAIRYFIAKRSRMIDVNCRNALFETVRVNAEESQMCRFDMETLLARLSNKRYAAIIRRLVIDDAVPEDVAREFGITTANLYNIKKRAIAALAAIALADVKIYGREHLPTTA